MYTLAVDIDFASVPGAVEAAELGVDDERSGGLLRQIAVAACNMHPADAELSNLTVGQGVELVDLENDIGDVGEGRAYGDGLSRPQALAACVGARLRGTVGIDDLSSATRPGLHQRVGEGLAGRHDIAAQRVGQIQLGVGRKGGQQHRRAEQYGDLGFTQDWQQIRAGSNLLPGQHDHRATRYPGAVHLGDTAVVPQ